ncbi:MAG: rod shape-determining protein MreD [Proteobacteria bacterium]|nr:MAG: rod shape-determining protein MreD [Pseudomonadota bacterium]
MNSPFRIFSILLLGLLAIFIQGTLLQALAPGLIVVPNFIIIMVVFLAFYETSVTGALIAFTLGLELDFASGVLLGPWCGACVVVYAFFSSISQRVFVDAPAAVFLAVLAACPIAQAIFLTLLLQFRSSEASPLFFSLRALTETALTALLAPWVFGLLRRVVLKSERSWSDRKTGKGWEARKRVLREG